MIFKVFDAVGGHSIAQFVLKVDDAVLILFLDDEEIGAFGSSDFVVTIGDNLFILTVDEGRLQVFEDDEVFIVVESYHGIIFERQEDLHGIEVDNRFKNVFIEVEIMLGELAFIIE